MKEQQSAQPHSTPQTCFIFLVEEKRHEKREIARSCERKKRSKAKSAKKEHLFASLSSSVSRPCFRFSLCCVRVFDVLGSLVASEGTKSEGRGEGARGEG